MRKQTKSKKSEIFGKGKVTPVQIAFLVDRYLYDNNYTQTRSTFLAEASDVISRRVEEVPQGMLTLGAILDDYIRLKEQSVMLDQEKHRLGNEKIRLQNLLQGMQDAMDAYYASGGAPPPPPPPPPMVSSATPQSQAVGSCTGYPPHNTPVMMPLPRPSNTPSSFATPISNHPSSKRRKGSKVVLEAPVTVKRSRNHPTTTQLYAKGDSCSLEIGSDKLTQSINAVRIQENPLQFSTVRSPSCDKVSHGLSVQGSSVAKCLFNQPSQSPPANTSGPKTPPQATSSQTDKSLSPLEISSTATSNNNITPQQVISTNCTVIASEAVRVSPAKQISYYSIERNHCISSSPVQTSSKKLGKRDHVRGRLDFDGSDTPTNSEKPLVDEIVASQSNKDVDIFDLDLPNLDALGVDFSLSELLVDFDIDCNYTCQTALGSPDSGSSSQNELGGTTLGDNQVLSEFSSTVTEIVSEKDINVQGPDSVTSVKSITKCIKILSPAKGHTFSPSKQEKLSARN